MYVASLIVFFCTEPLRRRYPFPQNRRKVRRKSRWVRKSERIGEGAGAAVVNLNDVYYINDTIRGPPTRQAIANAPMWKIWSSFGISLFYVGVLANFALGKPGSERAAAL